MSEQLYTYQSLLDLSATIEPRARLAMRNRHAKDLSAHDVKALTAALMVAIGQAMQCKAARMIHSSSDQAVRDLNRKLDLACGYTERIAQDPQ